MKFNSRSLSIFVTTIMLVWLPGMSSHADEDAGFDVPGTLSAHDLLPADLIAVREILLTARYRN